LFCDTVVVGPRPGCVFCVSSIGRVVSRWAASPAVATSAAAPETTSQASRPDSEVSVSVLRIENVYKVFGRRPAEAVNRLRNGSTRSEVSEAGLGTAAVIDASFEVNEGEIFVVMGLSGSGKSTLIRTP